MKLLLCSAGRRPYLIRWFREAIQELGQSGEVIVADVDGRAPARAFTDNFAIGLPVSDPEYDTWLRAMILDHGVDLALSINDFELSRWAGLSDDNLWKPLVRLSKEVQELIEDKYAAYRALTEKGIDVPKTWLASEGPDLSGADRVVTKGRFGSASRGLNFTRVDSLRPSLQRAVGEVTTRTGVPALEQDDFDPFELVVVQEYIGGVEYGMDVVCDLQGRYAAALVRRKLAMRYGETDRAVSVDPAPFERVARRIAEAIPHPGTLDVDLLVDSSGVAHVIDINPRFGGGYPFSHVAGARVPHAYVAWSLGIDVDPAWLRSQPGIASGKYVEVTSVGTWSGDGQDWSFGGVPG